MLMDRKHPTLKSEQIKTFGKTEAKRKKKKRKPKHLWESSLLRETVKDWEAWRATVHGVAKSWTRLSNNNEASLGVLPATKRKKNPPTLSSETPAQ